MTNTIMACIDGSNYAPAVCDAAAWASLRLNAPLTFLHSIDRSKYPQALDYSGSIGLGSREHLLEELTKLDEQRGKLEQEQGRLMLEAAKQRAVEDGIKDPQIRKRNGALVETLDELRDGIRMIVLGKRGEEANSATEHVGSQLERVIRHLHLPILITTESFAAPANILLAFDGSETARKCVELMTKNELLKGLNCHVVMVGDSSTAAQEQIDWAINLLTASGLQATGNIVSGNNVEYALRDYKMANNIDMMVMGAYGHSRIRRFLVGSTTTEMIRKASIPILVLR